jgi:hypothetical protein
LGGDYYEEWLEPTQPSGHWYYVSIEDPREILREVRGIYVFENLPAVDDLPAGQWRT